MGKRQGSHRKGVERRSNDTVFAAPAAQCWLHPCRLSALTRLSPRVKSASHWLPMSPCTPHPPLPSRPCTTTRHTQCKTEHVLPLSFT